MLERFTVYCTNYEEQKEANVSKPEANFSLTTANLCLARQVSAPRPIARILLVQLVQII